MARILTLLVTILLVALGLGALLGYLAYGTGPAFEGEVEVAGLDAPVTIAFTDTDLPVIEAQSEGDLFAGLGYVHALQSAWPMALWRQAARGSLSMWFEDSTANLLDRHTLTLGFGGFARATYDALPDDERALLEAYARGVNQAFSRGRLNEGDEFVLFDVRAEPWQPWDALTVERLVAYLATPSVIGDSTARAAMRAHAPLRHFAAVDSVFRNTLYIGGLGHSLAFSLGDSTGTTFAQRHVVGRSALPLFRETVLRRGDRSALVATIPGTLMMPSGYGDYAWSIFLNGATTLTAATDSVAPEPTFARIVTRGGNESLVEVYRRGSTLLFYDADAEPLSPAPSQVGDAGGVETDSLVAPPPRMWEMEWRGFSPGTDLNAWRALLRGDAVPFDLVPGNGLVFEGAQARVLGNPSVVRSLPGGTFVGGHPRSEHVAERLRMWTSDSVSAGSAGLLTDAYSTWAAELAPPLVATLGEPGAVADDLREVSAYLRGWDFRYAPSSIAASIFDVWLAVHQRKTGALPDLDVVTAPPPPPDSMGVVPEQPAIEELKASLRQALDLLEAEHGALGAEWRWQNVQGAIRYYPLFARDASETGRRRFAPTVRPDGGHPTTLAWGPSPVFPGPEASATWAAQSRAPDWSPVLIRHRDLYDATYRTRRLIDPVEPYAAERDVTLEPRLRLAPAGS